MTMVIAVVGPTATGKSDLALELAAALGGEIINADAFQLYCGLDIGTAKLPVDQRRGIVHHQLDVLDPREVSTVAAYQLAARADLAGIVARGHRPIVVGGSGLYVRALLDQMEFPGTDPTMRAALEARAEAEGTATLFAELLRADPDAAAAIGPRNTRRIIRALEAMSVTGRPFSATLPRQEYVRPTLAVGLDADRGWLDERVERRVERMWAEGLVDEVRGLASPEQGGYGAGLGPTAARAVGYAEVIAMLRGDATEAETKAAIAANTRRLARKQMGWFGRDARIHWLDAAGDSLAERVLELVSAADSGELDSWEETELTRRPLGSVGGG